MLIMTGVKRCVSGESILNLFVCVCACGCGWVGGCERVSDPRRGYREAIVG